MKRDLTLLLAAVVGCAITAEAQINPAPAKVDSVLLSDQTEGDQRISRYLVSEEDDADYALRYRINNATLNRSLNGNEAELTDLKNLVTGFLNDTLAEVEQITIKGYASPDGPAAFNRSLAKRRAEDMKQYVDRHYNFSTKYAVRLDSEVAAWSSLRDRVAASPIPMKDSVLMILDGRHTEAEKQAALKQLPEAWRYLTATILPPVRRVEMVIDYKAGTIVEHRTTIAPPKPAPQPTPQPEVVVVEEVVEEVIDPCCRELCASDQLGIIVDMPDVEVDF